STYLSGTYYQLSGTSMATPHVAGLAALMLSRNPALTPAQVKTALETTALDIAASGPDDASGYGLINAPAALQAIPGAPLAVTTSSLPHATEGMAYEQTLSASGGTKPYTWSMVSGSLPGGMSLSSEGVLSGTPVSAGTYGFTVRVRDAASPAATADKQLSLVVDPPLTYRFPAGISLISFPYQPSDPDTTRLLLLGAGEDMAWWDPVSGSYDYYSGGSSLQSVQPGIGYWIKLTSPRDITAAGSLITDAYSVTLNPGWNQIGLPYNYTLPWSSLLVKQGSVTRTIASAASAGWVENYGWYYAGGQYNLVAPSGGATASLQPWLGYWIHADVSAELIFPAPVSASSAAVIATGVRPVVSPRRLPLPRVNLSSWSMEITATGSSGQSDGARLGVAGEGVAGELRILKPPALKDMLYLGIIGTRKGVEALMDSDIRSDTTGNGRLSSRLNASGASQTWEILLNGTGVPGGGVVTLSWDISSSGQKPSGLFLVDADGKRIDMLRENSYTISSVTGVRRLRIEASPDASLEDDGRRGIIRQTLEPDNGVDDGQANENSLRLLSPRQTLTGTTSGRLVR
ncbi:MAG: S8 family serine peptidase, partial [bacterium]|nr:S8 family serine peptidase [bacterium]